jgi:hypothetical protein
MKKTIKSLLAIAVAAFAFTACSDVPEPEGYNSRQGDGLIDYTPEGVGTLASPYNVAGVLQATKDLAKGAKTGEIYTKGFVSKKEFSSQYGSFNYYITDNKEGKSKAFYVYSGIGLNKEKFTSENDLNVGDAVTICGTIVNYNGTIEYEKQNYLVELNGKTAGGGGGGGSAGTGSGTETDPYDVAAAIAAGDKTNVFTKAFIVGSAYSNQETKQTEWNFGTTNAQASNILVATSATETDPTKCMAVALPSGSAVRTGLNLKDNPGNLGKEVLLYGNITKYFGQPGIKETTYAKIGETEFGTKPGGGGGGGSTAVLDIDFTQGQGNWVLKDVVKPADLTFVWQQTAQYGMKASAFANNTRYATDSWLVSPAFTLTKAGTMTFSQAQRYSASGCTDLHVMYSASYKGGDIVASQWTEVTPSAWPDGTNWNFIDCTAAIPATAKYVAFRYTSTSSTAGTWEIKTVKIE